MTTIQDVARAAGVAASTVSRYVNGQLKVSPATEAKVLEAVAELGYVPNAAGRNLARRRSGVIGFVVPARLHVLGSATTPLWGKPPPLAVRPVTHPAVRAVRRPPSVDFGRTARGTRPCRPPPRPGRKPAENRSLCRLAGQPELAVIFGAPGAARDPRCRSCGRIAVAFQLGRLPGPISIHPRRLIVCWTRLGPRQPPSVGDLNDN